jgi:hypothetical protein
VRAVVFLICLLFPGVLLAQIQQAWLATYNNGLTNGTHQAVLMKLDPSGNLIVTGFSQNTNNNLDYVTIKYAPNGTRLWAARHNSTNNADDQPRGLAVDEAGNVYLTGTSDTVKYDSAGQEQWSASYGGQGLALDTNGNVYVTGFLSNVFSTVKLNASGSNLWMRIIDFPGHTADGSHQIAVDTAGNAYVAGQVGCDYFEYVGYGLIKYDLDGNQLWGVLGFSNAFACTAIKAIVKAVAVDPATGDVTITGNLLGSGGYDFATVRYASDGTYEWRYLRAYTSSDSCAGMNVDGAGQVYLTGFIFIDDSLHTEWATIKLNSNGVQAWKRQYGGGPSPFHAADGVVLDGQTNIFVTGFEQFQNAPKDITTIMYDNNGNQLWVQRYDGPAHGNDEGKSIAVDAQGSVYVAGSQTVPGGGTELILIKYADVQNIILQTNGTVQLQWFSNVGQNYRIQATTTLTNWQDIATVQANNSNIYSFTDTNAPSYPYRFYRSVSP